MRASSTVRACHEVSDGGYFYISYVFVILCKGKAGQVHYKTKKVHIVASQLALSTSMSPNKSYLNCIVCISLC